MLHGHTMALSIPNIPILPNPYSSGILKGICYWLSFQGTTIFVIWDLKAESHNLNEVN